MALGQWCHATLLGRVSELNSVRVLKDREVKLKYTRFIEEELRQELSESE